MHKKEREREREREREKRERLAMRERDRASEGDCNAAEWPEATDHRARRFT
jgi:hypothetical protein